MGVQIPSELHWLVQIVCGDEWPQGDEDKLRVLAVAWDEASRELTAVRNEVDSVTAAVLGALQGTASEEFRKFTEAFKQQVPDVAATAKQLGDLARETALQVEYAKYMIIGTLIMLAMQIVWALANAFWTFGASTATIPAMQAAARISVQAVLKNLIKAVLFGIVFQVGMDAAIQGIQMLKGDRTKWDTDLTKGAAITGAIGGVIGFGLGAAASKFAPKFARSIPGEMVKGGLHEWLTEQVSGVVQGNWNGLNPAAASAGAIEGAVDGAGGRKKKGGGTQAGTNKIAATQIDGVDHLDLSKMPSMTDSPVAEADGKPTRDPVTRTASAQPVQSTSDQGGKADTTTTTTPPPAPVQPVTTPSTAPKQAERPASSKSEPAPAPPKAGQPKTQPVSTEPVKPVVTPEPAKAVQPKPTVPQPEPQQQASSAKPQPVQSPTTQSQPGHQPAQSPVTHARTEPVPQPVRTQHAEPAQPVTPASTATTSASNTHTPATAQPVATSQPATQPAPLGIPALDGPDKAGPQSPSHGSQLAASTPVPAVTPPPVFVEPQSGHPAPQPTPVPVSTTATTTTTPPPIAPSTSDTPIPRSVPPMSRPAPPSPRETSHQPTVVAHSGPSSHNTPPATSTESAPVNPTPVPTIDIVTTQALDTLAPDWTKPGVGLEFQTFLSVHTGTGDAKPKTTVLKDVVRGSDGRDHILWELTVDNRDAASTKWLGTDGNAIGQSTVLEYVTQPVGTHNHQAVLDRITTFTTILADQLVRGGGQVDITTVWDTYRDQLKSAGKPRPIADKPDQPALKVGKPNESIDIAFQVRPQATFDSSLSALPDVLKEIANTGFGREVRKGTHDLQADLKARIAEFDGIVIPGDTKGNVKGLAGLAHLYLTLDEQGFGLLPPGTVQQKPYHHFMVRRDFHGLWQGLSASEKDLWKQHVADLKASIPADRPLYPGNFKESNRLTAHAWLDSIADPSTVLFPNAKLDENATPWVDQVRKAVLEDLNGKKTRPDETVTDLLKKIKLGKDILGAEVEAAKQHLSETGKSKVDMILAEVREHGKDLVSTLTGEAIGKMPKATDPGRAVTFEWRSMADVPGGQRPSTKKPPTQVTDPSQITGYRIWAQRTAELVGLLPPATTTGENNRSVTYHPTVSSSNHQQYSPTVLPSARPAPPPATPPPSNYGPRSGPALSAQEITEALGKQPTPDHPKLGKDPFGVRRAPEAPEFLGKYDYTKLHAGKRVDFFRKLDLLEPEPDRSAMRPDRLTEHQGRVTEGARVGRNSGWGVKNQKVPHLVHSIWMGGALFDDGGARREFRENIASSARHHPDFDFVVWTDVSRQDIEQARNTAEADRTPRQRDVAEMAHWAGQHNVRLVNLDEVFNAHNPMLFDAEVRTERARGNPAGWASASDLIRLEILNRFGGIYTDGDNTVQPPKPGERSPLSANVEQIADDKLGFGLSRDRDGRITNSALVAAAGTTAVRRYLDLIGANLGKSRLELFGLENASDATKHRVNLKENVKDDTIFRTGPHMFTYTELAHQLGITKDRFPQVPDTVVHVESSQSWLGGSARGAAFDERTVLDAVKGAVTSLHRELAARPGYLLLAPAARTINRLPEPQREAAWHATLDLVTDVERNSVQAISAVEIKNAQAVEVRIPESVRARLLDDFPLADYVHGTKDGTENTDPLLWAPPPPARSAPSPVEALPKVQQEKLDIHGAVTVHVPGDDSLTRFRHAVAQTLVPTSGESTLPHGDSLEEIANAANARVHVLQPNGEFTAHGPIAGEPVHVVRTADGRFLATREDVHIGRPGVAYPGPSRKPVPDYARPDPIHRGEFEIETIAGEHFVRVYTAVVNPSAVEVTDGQALGRSDYKDVRQDANGKITMSPGLNKEGNLAPMWTGAGRPLRAIQWLKKYELDPANAGHQPMLRSYLVPLDTYRQVTEGALHEDTGKADPTKSTNVDWTGDANQFGIRVGTDGRGHLLELANAAVDGSLVTYVTDPESIAPVPASEGGRLKPVGKLYERLGMPMADTDVLGRDYDPWFTWNKAGGGAGFQNSAPALLRMADELREFHLTWSQLSGKDGGTALIDPDIEGLPGSQGHPDRDTGFEERKKRLNQFLNSREPMSATVKRVDDEILRTGGPLLEEHLGAAPHFAADVPGVRLALDGTLESATSKAFNSLKKAFNGEFNQAKKPEVLKSLLSNEAMSKKGKKKLGEVVLHTVGEDFAKAVAGHPDLQVLDRTSREELAGKLRQELVREIEKRMGALAGHAGDLAGKHGEFWERLATLPGELRGRLRTAIPDAVSASTLKIDRHGLHEVLTGKALDAIIEPASRAFTTQDLLTVGPDALRRKIDEEVLPQLENSYRSVLRDHPMLAVVDADARANLADSVATEVGSRAREALAGFTFTPVDPGAVAALMAKVPDVATQAAIGGLLAADYARMKIDFNIGDTPFPNDFHRWNAEREANRLRQQEAGLRLSETLRRGNHSAVLVDQLLSEFPELGRKFDEVCTQPQLEPNRSATDAGKKGVNTFYEHAQMVLGQYLELTERENHDERFIPVDALAKAILFHDIEKNNSKNQFGNSKARHDREPEHKLAVEMMDRYRGLWHSDRDFLAARRIVDSDPFGAYFKANKQEDVERAREEAFRFISDLADELDPERPPGHARKLFEEFHQYYQADFSSYTEFSGFRDKNGETKSGPPHFNRHFTAHEGQLARSEDGRHFRYSAEYQAKLDELAKMFDEQAPQGRSAPPRNDMSWQHSESATADWAQPKNPLPPSLWESLRDRAPVRTVDYEARDILRSSTPKKLDFIPGLVRYDVRRMEVEPGRWVQEYTLKVHLAPGDGISPQALADARAKALAGVDSLLNKGYRLPSGDQFHVRVEFTETDAHTTVKLTGTENANQVEWGTATPKNVLAHEIAHYFGLPDEYRDSGRWKRIFNSDGKPLPGGREPLNAVIEDAGLMGQQVHHAPTLLPRHLWRIEQTMTSQVHLPDGSHSVLTDPKSPVQTPLDLPKHGFRSPEESLGPVPPARPNRDGQVLLDRMARGHTFSSGEREVLRRIVDGLPEEIATDPALADRIVSEIPTVAVELAGNLASLRETVARWQAQRVAPADITGLIVAHADEVVHKALATAVRIAGAPAHPWAVVALGGYGRKELAPASDLDFAIIGDVEDDSPGHHRLHLLQNLTCDVLNLARERLNASLPPGTEPVLFQADPLWLPTHKSARPEWLAEHSLVTAEPGLPNFGIGFDARMVPVDLPGTDASVFDRFREPHERLSPGKAQQALGDLIPSAKSTMDIKGKFDVKEALLRPLTLGTRWLGASEGQLGRSNTADRLRTLGDLGVLKRDQAAELRTAFDTVQGLRQKLHAHYGRENDEARLPAPLTSRISALFAGSPAKPDHVYVLTDAEAKSILAARDTIARYLDFLDGYRLPAARPAPQKTGYELSERQHTELGRLGRRERWVPADGRCLFHALEVTAAERLGGATSERIRHEIADRVENATDPEADRYRLLLTPDEGQTAMTLAEAATAIRTDSGYYTSVVGDLAVQAVADRYGLRLSLVNGDGSVTSIGDGDEVVLVRTVNERKAAHFWATEAGQAPAAETPQAPVSDTRPASAPDYLNQGLLGTGHVERVLGHPVSDPDAITAALLDAMADGLPSAVEKQARQAIVTLVEQHGPAGAMRRILAGEQLAVGDTPARMRLRVTGTQAAPVGAEAPTAAVTGTVSTTATTSATSVVNPLSAAVAVTSAVADGHFLTVKPTLKPIDERTGQQATTHTTEIARSVTGTGGTGFDVDAVLDISVEGRTHPTELPSALRVRYPGEASSVTADRQAVTAPDAIHHVFGVVEDAVGLTAIRDALLDQPGIVPGSPLHRAITDRFSVDTPATHGGQLLGGVLTATDGIAGVAVRSRPTHFQRVGTGVLTLEQSVGGTHKDKTAHAGAFGAEVGVAVSYGAPGVKIPSGEVKIAASASASAGPARSLTTAAAIEGTAKTTLKYDGDTVLYRVDTEYAVEGTGLDYRETHQGQVYVRVPSWQAAEFEASLRGEDAAVVSETKPLDPPAAPDGGTAVALSAVDSVTGLGQVAGKATELLDDFFVDRKTPLGTVKAQLAEALSVVNLRDSYEQLHDGLRVPISVAGRNLTLTVKAYLRERPVARRVGTVEIASSTGSTGSVESKDTKSSNRGAGLEAAVKIGLDRDKPGLLAGLTLGGAAKWQDADSSANSAAAGSVHKLIYSGPGVAVTYPATFEVALAEGGRAKGEYVPGAVRMVLPESDCLPLTFTAIPAASDTLSPTGAVSLPPGSALPGRLDHVGQVDAAIAQALAVARKGAGARRGLTELTLPRSVAQARFDRMLNGGLDLQLLAPGAVHRRTDAVRVELELRHPKLVGDGEGVTSETRHTSSAGTESGHTKSWGVEGYAQAGVGVSAGVRKGAGGEDSGSDSVSGKNTSTIKRSGTHLKYRADAVYQVTAYSWQDGLGADGHPATHRIAVVLPEGVEYWMPKDRAEKANLPVPGPSVSTVDSKVWYLPEHLAAGKSLGNAAVDEVSPATRILPEAQRLLNLHAPEFAPYSRETGAPTGAIPVLRAAFSPSDVKAALRRAAAAGQSVVVHRSTWRGLRQLEIRVGARLDTANARSTGSERITTDSAAEGSSAHATSKTKNSIIAATLDAMAPKVQADPASAVGGVPAGGLLAGAQTSGTDSTSHTVKNTDKIKGGGRSVRFEVPVEYLVEIFRDGKRVDGTTLRDGTASLLVPEELCPTTEAADAVVSHPGAVDLRGAKVLAQAMPGGPELAAELRRLITDSANDVAFFRAGGITKLVAEGGHGGQKTAVFTDEDLRIGNFGRLLDGIGQTVVDNDLATTTGYRFGMRLEVVSPELLGAVELTTEQATKITTETGTANQATTTGNLSLGGTVQGATGPGTTGGTPGIAATAKKSTAAQTTGTGNREETVTHSGTYYRYRATARYDLSVAREQGNVLDRRFGTGTRHRVVTVPDGVYFLVPKAEAERVKLPLPGQPPARRPAAEPEAPVDREPPREPDEAGRHWSALSTVEALKLAMKASSTTDEEDDESDVRITPPPSIARPEGRA
ncbi:putative nucleotidyltransferase substrate binding domain-containing protein [Amycolatopsis sp. NPDC049868]|uniref:WXG100-like domain-containing protein n=1 Tax=Amycolatopsis sp. NPDC049868 TaxID=3363934 RepID=UPI0037B01C9E